jgi:hypothetical protein
MSSDSSPYAPPNQPASLPPFPDSGSGRPVGVTVIAIVAIAFGGLGLIGIVVSAVMQLAGVNFGQPNPAMDLFQTSPLYKWLTILLMVVGFFFTAVQLVSGFGLLKMSERARKWILICAIYSIIAAIISSLLNLVYLMPAIRKQMEAQAANAPPIARGIMEVSMYGGMVVGVIFALVLPVVILWYFNRAEIKAKFAAATSAAANT